MIASRSGSASARSRLGSVISARPSSRGSLTSPERSPVVLASAMAVKDIFRKISFQVPYGRTALSTRLIARGGRGGPAEPSGHQRLRWLLRQFAADRPRGLDEAAGGRRVIAVPVPGHGDAADVPAPAPLADPHPGGRLVDREARHQRAPDAGAHHAVDR